MTDESGVSGGCQGKFAPSERPKMRVTERKEFEGEMKEKKKVSPH